MRVAGIILIFSLAACTSVRRAEPDEVIMAPVHQFVRALTYADLDALEDSFAADATLFMPFDELPRRIGGGAAIREAFAPYFRELQASDRKPPYFKLEPRDLTLQRPSDGIAIVTFHLGELPTAGVGDPVRFSRRTFVVKRAPEGWRIAHLHASNVTVAAPGGS